MGEKEEEDLHLDSPRSIRDIPNVSLPKRRRYPYPDLLPVTLWLCIQPPLFPVCQSPIAQKLPLLAALSIYRSTWHFIAKKHSCSTARTVLIAVISYGLIFLSLPPRANSWSLAEVFHQTPSPTSYIPYHPTSAAFAPRQVELDLE